MSADLLSCDHPLETTCDETLRRILQIKTERSAIPAVYHSACALNFYATPAFEHSYEMALAAGRE